MEQGKDSDLQSQVEELVKAATNEKGKVDIDLLREKNPSLAAVLNEFVEGKTARDDPIPVIKDLVRTIDGRNPKSRLGAALERLEMEMKLDR